MRRLILASVFFSAVASSWALPLQVQETLRNWTDVLITDQISGVLLSPGFTTGQPVPHNFKGWATIQAPMGFSRIRLDFEEFHLETSVLCMADKVVIKERNPRAASKALCSNLRPKAYLSSSSVVDVMLFTDGLKSSRGFRIRFTATNSLDVCDNPNQYQCRSAECIPTAHLCDGKFDCVDGTDEHYCAVASSWALPLQVQETLRNWTDVRITDQISGVLLSPGFTTGQPVPHNFEGWVTIQAPRGFSRIRLDFEEFDLETSAQCMADRVLIPENNAAPKVFCSSLRPRPYLSSSSVAGVMLFTDGLKSSRGFRIRFTATNNPDVCGNPNQYQCANAECIPSAQRCDGKFDCADGTDEQSCQVELWRRNLVSNVPCGSPVVRPVTEDGDRILGGREAVPHSWPWQASIQRSGIFPSGHFCGAALIRNDVVITAAHCVHDVGAEDVVVKFGSHNILDHEAGVQIRSVDVISMHKNFSASDTTNDVAVLKLTLPVNFTDHVRPVCMPGPEVALPMNTACYTTGWGTTRGTGSSFLLKQVRLTVREFNKGCRNMLSLHPNLRKSHMVCATDDSDVSGPCYGDSGGPLVCRLDSSSKWTLVGMTSQGTHLTVTHALCGMGTGTVWSGTIPNRRWIENAVRTL